MGRYISIGARAALFFVALLASMSVTAQAPFVPFCTDFDDAGLHSFAPCPQRANVTVRISDTQTQDPTVGPSGVVTDRYLHLRDGSGASLVCGSGDFAGDWTTLLVSGCAALCFDIRIFEDACVPSIPECAANGGWIPILPSLTIQGGTSGETRASFVGHQAITDDVGANGGWHRLCAPIALMAADGTLPSNADGQWQMVATCDVLGGAVPCPSVPIPPNSAFDDLIANVLGLNLRIDFTGNPAERAGYDNLCVRDDVCPSTVLAVTFDVFDAVRVAGDEVLVSWRTASEDGSTMFTVERALSDDGPFSLVATVAAAGGGDYSYLDSSAGDGEAFYRIIEYTVDGSAGDRSLTVSVPALTTADRGGARSREPGARP